MLAHLKWTYPQARQWFAAASHLQACQMAWRGCGHSRAVCDAIHRRGGCWPIRGNSRGPYRTVAIGGGLRPCWPSDSRAWSSTADGSSCMARDRTVGDSSGTYVVGSSLACKPESDRLATRTTSRIKRRRPKGRRPEQTRKKMVALEPGKKTTRRTATSDRPNQSAFSLAVAPRALEIVPGVSQVTRRTFVAQA